MEKALFREGIRFLMSSTFTNDAQLRAQTALASSPIYELRDLKVKRHDGALLICGAVSSFYHKQLAQEVIRSVSEDVKVINSIRVE